MRLIRWIFHPLRLRVYLFVCLWVVTLAVLFTLIENWRGHRAWETVRNAYEAAGEPLTLQELVPPPVPDDQNIAMAPFLAPLFDFHPGTQSWRDTNGVNRAFRATRRWHKLAEQDTNHWMLGQRKDLAAWAVGLDPDAESGDVSVSARVVLDALLEYEPVLEELNRARERPFARFNIQYDAEDPATTLLPHLSVLRTMIRILALRASANLALDHPEAAWRDVRLGFHLIDTIRDEPIVVSQWIRCKMLDEVLQPVWEGWVDRKWPARILLEIQSRWQRRSNVRMAATARRVSNAESHWSGPSLLRLSALQLCLRGSWDERICPLQPLEPAEVRVSGTKCVAPFDRQCRQMRVGRQVPRRAQLLELGAEAREMALGGNRDVHVGKRQPFFDPRTDIGWRHRIPQDPAMRGDSNESEHGHPCQPNSLRSR